MKIFSIKANIFGNMLGMIVIVLLNLIATPYYIKHLGSEAFGLVGFFYLFSMVLSTLDFGMSPYLQREVAKYTKNREFNSEFQNILKIIAIYFIFLVLIINLLAFPFSGIIINYWFSLDAWELLSINDIDQSIKLIFLTSSLIIVFNLFKFGLTGCHHHYWLNVFMIFIAVLRYGGSVILITFYGADIVDFFIYQAIIAGLSVVVMGKKFLLELPSIFGLFKNFQTSLVRGLFSETSKIAILSILWVATYQLDKILLSKTLPLTEYGYFSLISILCSGIILISTPIKRAIQPTVSIMHLSDSLEKSIDIYRKASQLTTIIVGSIVITLIIYSVPIALFWTKDLNASLWIADRLYLFVIGAGLASVQSILYALQESRGDLKLQIKLNLIFLIIQIPLMLLGVIYYGVIGIGLAWLLVRISSFLVSTTLVHKRYDLNLNRNWFIKDIFPIFFVQIIAAIFLIRFFPSEVIFDLDYPIVGVAFAGIFTLFLSLLSSHFFYNYLIGLRQP